MADLGTERVARRPQSMDSSRIKTASGKLLRKGSRSPRVLPSVSKGERWHSQLDNFTCELTGFRRRPIVVSARRAARLQREQEREAGVLSAPVPYPQPTVQKREYKPPPPLRTSLLHRPVEPPPAVAANKAAPSLADPPRLRPAGTTAKPGAASGGASAGGAAAPAGLMGSRARDSSGGSSSSGDAGQRLTQRPASRPPSAGWTSQYSPAVTGKCRSSSRAKPVVPALPSLTPESLRKVAARGRSGAPAPQGAAGAQASKAKPGFGLGNYLAAASIGGTQGPAVAGEAA